MTNPTTTPAAAALAEFAAVWSEGYMAHDLAPKLGCREANTLANLLTTAGDPDAAAVWLQEHSTEDDEGDDHYVDAPALLVAALEAIDKDDTAVTFDHSEPDAFGAGHLVLDHDDQTRFAVTELCDLPDDDDRRRVIGWNYVAEIRTDGLWARQDTGLHRLETVHQLIREAQNWAEQQTTRP